MFNSVLKEVSGILDRRFLLNAFFPSLIFLGLIIIVAILGAGWDLVKLAQAWNQQDVTFKTLQIVAFLSFATFFSGILASQFTTILRFYEGYWNFPFGRSLANIGKNWHKARLKELYFDEHMGELDAELKKVDKLLQQTPPQKKAQKLQKQKARLQKQKVQLEEEENLGILYESIYLYYPLPTKPEEVMPTRLGNILKNSELYSLDRYELDSVLIWPRLYNLFPDRFVQTIAEARSSLDFMLVISALSGIFGLVSAIYLLFIVKASGWLFLLCFWGGLFVAWLAYQGALGSALLYAQQIKAGFDLYRNELLKQLRLPLPKTPIEEIEQWDKIRQFLYSSNTQVSWQYTDPDEAKGQNSP